LGERNYFGEKGVLATCVAWGVGGKRRGGEKKGTILGGGRVRPLKAGFLRGLAWKGGAVKGGSGALSGKGRGKGDTEKGRKGKGFYKEKKKKLVGIATIFLISLSKGGGGSLCKKRIRQKGGKNK